MIDPHGEYASVFGNDASVFKINPTEESADKALYVPYWTLDSASLNRIIGVELGPKEFDQLESLIFDKKEDVLSLLSLSKESTNFSSPIPYNIKKLWFEIHEHESKTIDRREDPESKSYLEVGDWKTVKKSRFKPAGTGSVAPFVFNGIYGLRKYADALFLKLKDPKYKFIFQPSDYGFESDDYIKNDLDDLLSSWFCNDKKITILDLSEAPSECVSIIAGSILNVVYESLRLKDTPASGKNSPILFVLEEAHTYLSNSFDCLAKQVIQKIAKEGRKYGAGLMLVSQRASEIDETILSQCGTIISMRMNNSKDRGYVRASLQDELETITDLLPILRTGESIISGESTVIPMRVQFDEMIGRKFGNDPNVSECWKREKPTKENYTVLKNKWRKN